MTDNRVYQGLSEDEAKRKQLQYGKNELTAQKKESFLKKVFHILCEPMFLLLMVAAVVYFVLGEPRDGAIMLIFVAGIITIDVFQEWKTDKTLNALKDLSAPHIRVIREGREKRILSADLVPGDLMMIHEGVKIPADGFILRCADLRIDESSLTGETEGVWKIPLSEEATPTEDYWRKDYCYAGTLVTQGTATVKVDKIGSETEYGKIGADVTQSTDLPTPLQKQTGKLVRTCAIIAGVLFLLVTIFTWFNIPDHSFKDRLIESILSGVTLAMAMIPEEFPVILTVFLSMGAWRLARKHSLVRKLPSVETLGAVSVLCVDKTGTLTMNKMTLQETWTAEGDEHQLLETMGLACEPETYDPMEKAMLQHCENHGITKENLFDRKLVAEYAFTNELRMMGHVWEKDDVHRIAVKGSPESVLNRCVLSDARRAEVEAEARRLFEEGLRVIAIAAASLQKDKPIPEDITDCTLTFLGLVGLADPPREGVHENIKLCRKAGVRVVMITGDNGVTASAIAKKIGITDGGKTITGAMLETMSDEELREAVKTVSIFSRVLPAHKMRIVQAFQANGEIVAMTGDGVNDAPALKYADIGIAMGKRGSEVAREAADLILMDDNFSTIVETIKDGRRIYDNICKAVGYVFSIHIPIAFASMLAPFLKIRPSALLLLPLHVVLLELLIDPTCSVVLERQPAERDIMERKPRDPKEKLLTLRLLIKSVLQGVAIFAASFGVYYCVLTGDPTQAETARAMGLTVVMLANLFLVQVNSSNSDYAFRSMQRLAMDWVMWAVNIATLLLLAVILYTPAAAFLKLSPLSFRQLLTAAVLAAASVLWYEIVKLIKKLKQ